MNGMPNACRVVMDRPATLEDVTVCAGLRRGARAFQGDGKTTLQLWTRSLPDVGYFQDTEWPDGTVSVYCPFDRDRWHAAWTQLREWAEGGVGASITLHAGRNSPDFDARVGCGIRIHLGLGKICSLDCYIGVNSGIDAQEELSDFLNRLYHEVGIDDVVYVEGSTLKTRNPEIADVHQSVKEHLGSDQVWLRTRHEEVRARFEQVSLNALQIEPHYFNAFFTRTTSRWSEIRRIASTYPGTSVYSLRSDARFAVEDAQRLGSDHSADMWLPVTTWNRLDRIKGLSDPMETDVVCALEREAGGDQHLAFYSNDSDPERLIRDVNKRTSLDVVPG